MKEFPKILFININFRYDNSSGITISKIIDHFPKKKLGLLSFASDVSNIDIFGYKHQIVKKEEQEKLNKSDKNVIKKIYPKLKILIKKTVGRRYNKSKHHITDELKEWLMNFKPDYIYLNPDKTETIKLAMQAYNILNCKIIIHVMDDKVSINYPGILGLIYKKKLNKAFKDIVNMANIRISISNKMAKVYYKRYKKNFITFHNPISVNDWNFFIKKDFSLKKEIKIIYSGFVESTYKPIYEFCKVVNGINKSEHNNYYIKFVLYSKFKLNEKKQNLERFDFVQINDYVPQKLLPEVLTDADFLFLPLSFEKRLSFTCLSMPTKTTEYMISGTPIVIYAPKKTALVDYAIKYNWAHIITKRSCEVLKQKLFEIIDNYELRKNLSENATCLVKQNHDIKNVKKLFNDLLLK